MPPTVLIVDDHAGFRRAARAMLRSDGYDVVGEAPDGARALTEVARLRPQIVLLDIQLPDIDGFAVADQLSRVGGLTIILISSREAGEYGGQVEASPSHGFIAKSRLSGDAIRALTGVIGQTRTGATRAHLALVGLLVVVLGLVSARIGYAPFEFRHALQVLLTGLFVALMGLVATDGARWSRIGPLLVLTAVAWFAPGFRWASSEMIAGVAGFLSLLWVGVLGHALLTYPGGRITGPLVGGWVGLVYLASISPWPGGEALVAVALGLGLVTTAIQGRSRTWRERRLAVLIGVASCVLLGTYRWLPALVPEGARIDARPILEVGLMGTAAVLCAGMLRKAAARARVTDLVVDLGGTAGGGLQGALAEAIGDPTLQIGLWLPAESRYLDAAGRAFELPGPDSGRTVTPITDAGRPVALLVHDRAITADPALGSAIARAAELSSANAALQLDLRSEVEAVRASRGRLLTAGDEARRSIDRRLHEMLEPMLARIEGALSPLGAGDPLVQAVAEQLGETRRDLVELAQGVHPRLLDEHGLTGAIEALAARCEVPVDPQVHLASEPAMTVQMSLLFVISEALANVVKHAGASRVDLELTDDANGIHLEIRDDGVGGADVGSGTGLLGLRDRVEALGGHLVVTSLRGRGTRLVAALPAVVPGRVAGS